MDSRPDVPAGDGPDSPSPRARRFTAVSTALVGGFAFLRRVPTAAAHGGQHAASDPHWVSLGALLLGAELAVGGVYLGRNRWADRPRRAVAVALAGVAVLAGGVVALV